MIAGLHVLHCFSVPRNEHAPIHLSVLAAVASTSLFPENHDSLSFRRMRADYSPITLHLYFICLFFLFISSFFLRMSRRKDHRNFIS
jgi:hypothetical protein